LELGDGVMKDAHRMHKAQPVGVQAAWSAASCIKTRMAKCAISNA
jgi:hypothetical protein